MTENVDNTTEAPVTPENDTTVEQDETTADNGTKAAREAKKYRLKLRETETERDTLQAGLTAARTELVQTLISQDKTIALDPAAIADAGLDIDALFENGTLDPEALQTQLDSAKENKPWLFKNAPLIVPAEGSRPANTDSPNSFANAFKPGNN